MDVRCEKCRAEYEFDDARISEAGVSVKCTACGHVFRVKKQVLAVVTPVAGLPAPAQAQREWKVRQANGNVFTFRELTSLQKWIVERKVSRDDQISLTGESWKRLGNIAELASFFQVVEDAQKGQVAAATLAAQQNTPAPVPLVASPPAPVQQPPAPAPQASASVAGFVIPPQGGTVHPVSQPPMRMQPQVTFNLDDDDDEPLPKVRGSGAAKALLTLLVLAALGGGGYYGYYDYWLPAQKREEEARIAQEKQKAAEGDAKAKAEKDRQDQEQRQKQEKDRLALAAAAVATADAGAQDAGVAAHRDKEPESGGSHSFDWYMSSGDRLREADRAEAALNAYGHAGELEPNRAEPMAGKGLALLDMGSAAQAQSLFERALQLNPRYGVALMGLAETYRTQGKKPEAIQYYQKYLDLLPDGPESRIAKSAIEKLQH